MTGARTTVVKTYGRDCFLLVWNPLASAAMIAAGLRVGLLSDEQIRSNMERDALDMLSRGYRVVSSDELRVPLPFLPGKSTNYYRVTYERTSS